MPTPIITTKWECNKCGTTYENEESALNCENSHIEPKDKDEEDNPISPIISMEYAYKERYPRKISVLMMDDVPKKYNLED